MTAPPVGASTWASGSNVWRGHVGSFAPKPARRPTNRRFWAVPAGTRAPVRAASMRRGMVEVLPYAKNAKNPDRTGGLAANGERKKFTDADHPPGPPPAPKVEKLRARTDPQKRKNTKKT